MNFEGVSVDRRADVAIDAIVVAQREHDRRNRRPRGLSPREALVALQFETMLVSVAACNLANGTPLSDEDRERLLLAARRIDTLAAEALG